MSSDPRPVVTIRPGHRIHFMGIGGIGMSGLAGICLDRGAIVSGCDAKVGGTSIQLQRRGASISAGHDPSHLANGADLLVYSSAVSMQDPELVEARTRGIHAVSRGELLAALANTSHLIGVAGAHGKTTTSGMASQLLLHAGWDPTVVVGGIMLSMGTNARHGRGRYLVAETDESDGSFLHLSPRVAIVTNMDREHLNHYGTFDKVIEAFEQYVSQIRPGGLLIACADDPVVRERLRHPSRILYGFDPAADVTADRIQLNGYGSSFRVAYNGRPIGTFSLSVPGRHNVSNALAVVTLGLALDLPLATIREALAGFQGTGRRFQVTNLPSNIRVVEDYAHHPSEIRATLSADAVTDRHRLVVFQPHRFTRTHSLEQEFTTCFTRADGIIITDIYSAHEAPIPGVSGERLAGLIQQTGHPCVRYVPKRDLSSFVSRIARPGDTIFFLGAGDISDVCHDVAARLRADAGSIS